MVGKQEARFAQLFSRIRMNRYYSTRKVTSDDVKALFPKLAEDAMNLPSASALLPGYLFRYRCQSSTVFSHQAISFRSS